MADTTTTNLALTKPEVGASSDSWGTKLNADLDAIDAIFGDGAAAPKLRLAAGALATPSLRFAQVATGLYAPATDSVGVTINGTQRALVNSTGLTVTGAGSVSGTMTAATFSGSGASLTNLPAASLTGTVAAARLTGTYDINISGTSAGSATPITQVTGNATMARFNAYHADSTGGAFTLSLPLTPAAGDWVMVRDVGRQASNNNITIARNGSNIYGSAQDYIMDVEGEALMLVYETTKGWVRA